ncbi:MAG: terminase family protein, partial [Candidatus Izemoplasmatales bacterium]
MTQSLTNSSIFNQLVLKDRDFLSKLTPEERTYFYYDWKYHARKNQLEPPGDWLTWLILSGRGFGKTRAAVEWIYQKIREGYNRLAIIAPTTADYRDIIIEGESGLLNNGRPNERPEWKEAKRKLIFPNGAIGLCFTGEEPERLRGLQHEFAVVDELCAMKYPQDVMDMLSFGLRLGKKPRCMITTTPKPIKALKEIMKDPNTIVTKGSTYENKDNLSPAFFAQIVKKYEGTRLGQQEIYAEILEDNPLALWKRSLLDETRVSKINIEELVKIVVSIDPAVTATEESAETGITVMGIDKDDQGYLLDDLSLTASPHQWASQAISAYHKWKADYIIGEVNNGGDMVEQV